MGEIVTWALENGATGPVGAFLGGSILTISILLAYHRIKNIKALTRKAEAEANAVTVESAIHCSERIESLTLEIQTLHRELLEMRALVKTLTARLQE